MSTIRILIVDDQQLIRSGLAMVLGAAGGLQVVGEAGDGIEAVAAAARLEPDVILMDVQMPRMDGIAATREITRAHPSSRVIILTTFDVDAYAFGGLEAGASGFLLKDSSTEDILSAVHAVAAGDAVLAPRITAELVRRYEALSRPVDGMAEAKRPGAVRRAWRSVDAPRPAPRCGWLRPTARAGWRRPTLKAPGR